MLLYLQDILDSGTAIQSYVKGSTFDHFVQDRMQYSAVIREFEIIGEAVGKLPGNMKDIYPGCSVAGHKRLPQPSGA